MRVGGLPVVCGAPLPASLIVAGPSAPQEWKAVPMSTLLAGDNNQMALETSGVPTDGGLGAWPRAGAGSPRSGRPYRDGAVSVNRSTPRGCP